MRTCPPPPTPWRALVSELDELEHDHHPRGIPGGRRRTDVEGFVTISNREVFDRLGLVQSQVAELSVKLDPVAVSIARVEADLHDHENRMRALERRAWVIAGGAAVMGGAAGALASAAGL